MKDITENVKRQKAFIYINIIGCALLFCFPIFMLPREENLTWHRYLVSCGSVLAHLVVFYLNYFFLIKRFVFSRQWFAFFAINLLLIGGLSLCIHFWHDFWFSYIEMPFPVKVHDMGRGIRFSFILRDTLFMLLTAALAVAIRMTTEWQVAEKQKANMAVAVSQAELKNLKSQLNPHFLFNTLNNIYSLMKVDSEKAQTALLELSRTLRYVLYDDNQELVPLEKEVQFTKNYISLMSLRLTENTCITTEFPASCDHWKIVPLLFIPLVENAFKHGVSPTEPSFIDISIQMDGNEILCRVENSFFPKDPEEDKSGSGIGIENLRRRLALLYPDKHHFEHYLYNKTFVAVLKIVLN